MITEIQLGETYYYISVYGSICKETYRVSNTSSRMRLFGNMFRTAQDAETAARMIQGVLTGNTSTWSGDTLIADANVFSHPSCPQWATYAAVSSNGFLYWFENRPVFTGDKWHDPMGGRYELSNPLQVFSTCCYDTNVIQRHAVTTVPSWIKPNKHIWTCVDNKYYKVLKVGVYDESRGAIAIDCECVLAKEPHTLLYWNPQGFRPATQEPYTKVQMKSLVGKVLTHDDGLCHQLVHTYLYDGSILVGNDNKYFADGIMGCTADGVPTCNFKHLNENGEWVE